MANMPKQKPGKSEQVVETPEEFLTAVRSRLGILADDYSGIGGLGFDIDLAASEDNAKADSYYDEGRNAFTQSWKRGIGWNWCNPPYADIRPWVEKAVYETRQGAKTAMLVPASVGSNWWREWVSNKAYITYLNGRITFVGHTGPYPKDLALLLYAPFLDGGSCVWRWKE